MPTDDGEGIDEGPGLSNKLQDLLTRRRMPLCQHLFFAASGDASYYDDQCLSTLLYTLSNNKRRRSQKKKKEMIIRKQYKKLRYRSGDTFNIVRTAIVCVHISSPRL